MYYTSFFVDMSEKSIPGYRLCPSVASRRTKGTNVELAFSERSLRQLCESKATAERKLGAKIGVRLQRRVADLHAAAHVKDLVTGQPHEIENDQYTVRVVDDLSISFCANHRTTPRLASGKVDWSKVSRVKIVKIGDNNEHC
jgi:proteic killer suppression protein